MMRASIPKNRRRGRTLVEFALVSSVLVLVLFTVLICGLGVFRYQQVSLLAREGARWAAVHGAQYAKETGNSAATASDVFNQAILPRAVALDSSLLSSSVTWSKSNRIYDYNSTTGTYVGNMVTVTLSYQWTPEWLGQSVTMTSSSTVPMAY